jgi:hypothetical protein
VARRTQPGLAHPWSPLAVHESRDSPLVPIPAALGLASTAAPRRETAFTRPDAFHHLEHRWDAAFAIVRPMPPRRVTCATVSGFRRPYRSTARTRRGDRATSEITPFLPCPQCLPRLGLPSSSARRNVTWVSRPPSSRPYRSAPATSATGRAHGHTPVGVRLPLCFLPAQAVNERGDLLPLSHPDRKRGQPMFRTSVPGVSPGRQPGLLVQSPPLPATLAGGLTPVSRRGFRIRVVGRGISDGYAAAFRHRQTPPDLRLPEPRPEPCGSRLGVLRVPP